MKDAASWTFDGDEHRRKNLVGLVETLIPQAGESLRKAEEFCHREVQLDRLQSQVLQLLDGKAPAVEKPPTHAGRDSSPATGELAATLKMIAAHATLRTPEVASANSETNRRIMATLIDKSIRAHLTTPSPVAHLPPPHADIVGTLEGKFSVDNKGAAEYDVTLRLPEGRAGMGPDLGVNYFSSSGDGVLGSRFSFLTGFASEISRGRSLLARDDEVRSMELSANDRFYLDGKRLLRVAGSDYGKPGSVYRTEVDSFETIRAFGRGDLIETFVVSDKYGRKLTFGKYLDETDGYQSSFSEDAGSLDPCASSYQLKRVEDAQGNYVEFHYTHEGFGEWLLSRILYTGRPGAPPPYSIEFGYAKKERRFRTYHALRRSDNNHLLTSIKVLAAPDATLVAQYTPRYEIDPVSGKYHLTSLDGELSAGIGQPLLKLPPMLFSWSKTAQPAAALTALALPTAATRKDGGNPFAAADFSGQGRLDYVDASDGLKMYVSTRNGFGTKAESWLQESELTGDRIPTGARQILTGDFNGDLKTDLIVTGSDGILYIAASTGTDFKRWDWSTFPPVWPILR